MCGIGRRYGAIGATLSVLTLTVVSPIAGQASCGGDADLCANHADRQALLDGYQVGVTTLDAVLTDGWSGVDVVTGKFGIVRMTGPRERLIVEVGYRPIELALRDVTTVRGQMILEGATESWGWVTDMFLPSSSAVDYTAPGVRGIEFDESVVLVCSLTFVSSVLSEKACDSPD